MHTLLTILIGLAIAGWFLYCLYRMLRGARGRDCASCHLAGGFDYKSTAPVKPAAMKRKRSSLAPAISSSSTKKRPEGGANGSGR